MILKGVKYVVIPAVVLAAAGGLFFGGDMWSYVRSSARSLRASVRDQVPIEFELRRARDLLDEIIPEIHSSIRLIAKEEVEITNLREDIERGQTALAESRAAVAKLGGLLAGDAGAFTLGERRYSREAVKDELARRFERHKEMEVVLAGKRRLLATREKALDAAIQLLDKAKARKVVLQDKIASLASQHRLVMAAAVGSPIQVDHSKLAQTEKLIRRIKTRLDVAERVLAHQGRFVEPIEVDVVDEKDLLAQVNEYFAERQAPGEALAGPTTGAPPHP